MSIPYRPLGHIREVITAMGLEVTHAFDDLVFIEHNAFLLQMEEEGEKVSLYFNTDSDVNVRHDIATKLAEFGATQQLFITRKGTYTVIEGADEDSFQLAFNQDN